jgi:hypothetical protein
VEVSSTLVLSTMLSRELRTAQAELLRTATLHRSDRTAGGATESGAWSKRPEARLARSKTAKARAMH